MKKSLKSIILLTTAMTMLAVSGWSATSVPNQQALDAEKEKALAAAKAEAILEDRIAAMSIREKLGQMMVIGLESPSLDEGAKEMIRDYKIGGVILFDKTMPGKAGTKQLITNLQKFNKEQENYQIPLYMCIDQEGGSVVRMRNELFAAPSAQYQANNEPDYKIYEYALKTAEDIKQVGFNVNFAPVLDIGAGGFMQSRCYGNTVETVIKNADQAIKGYIDGDVIFSGKHFPGIGKCKADPHVDEFVVTASKETLYKEDIAPFKYFIGAYDNNKFMMMIGHIKYEAFGGETASVSSAINKDLLRKELGFKGVTITDDMEMGSLTKAYSYEGMGVKAVNSGIDILVVCHINANLTKVYTDIFKELYACPVTVLDLTSLI